MSEGKHRIDVELDGFEVENLSGLLGDSIIHHRQEVMLTWLSKGDVVGGVSPYEVRWHLRHAEYLESIARKLFPDFHSRAVPDGWVEDHLPPEE